MPPFDKRPSFRNFKEYALSKVFWTINQTPKIKIKMS
jgi:hypothetical protein